MEEGKIESQTGIWNVLRAEPQQKAWFLLVPSNGQQEGNWKTRLLCVFSHELDPAAASLVETECRSYAARDRDTRIEKALEFSGQRKTEAQSWFLFCFPAVACEAVKPRVYPVSMS